MKHNGKNSLSERKWRPPFTFRVTRTFRVDNCWEQTGSVTLRKGELGPLPAHLSTLKIYHLIPGF